MLLTAWACMAQTQFVRAVGGTAGVDGYSVVKTSDGGYAIAGITGSFGAGGEDFFLVKFDSTGSMEWSRAVGGTGPDLGSSVVHTSDGGYAVAGITFSFGAGNADLFLVKFSSTGAVEWSRAVGGTSRDESWSVVQATDGGYAVAGFTDSFGAGVWNFFLVKFTSTASVSWAKAVSGMSGDDGWSVVQTTDGGYAVAGCAESFGAGGLDFFLVKFSSTGSVEWSRAVGGTGTDYGRSVVQTPDGGYAVVGVTYSFGAGSADLFLVKLSSTGAVEWSRAVGGTGGDYGFSVIRTSDGGYAVAGLTESFGASGGDFFLVKFSSTGAMEWSRAVGGTSSDCGLSVVQTSDDGFAVAGYTQSFGTGGNLFFVKFDADGNSCIGEEVFPTVTDVSPTVTVVSPTVTVVSPTVTVVTPTVTDVTPAVTEICTHIMTPPVINFVTAVEETDCDGVNWVKICYDVDDSDGDSIFVDFSTLETGVPIYAGTINNLVPGYPAPNLGWVYSGTHCFYWEMNIDYPGHESCDFEVEIQIMNETMEILTVTDSFPIIDAEGVAWDGTDLRVTRSTSVTGIDTQRVFRVDPITHEVFADSCVADLQFEGYTADCEWHDGYLWILGGGLSGQRAKLFKYDPTTCTKLDSSDALIPGTRWGQGIAWYGTHFYATDSRGKIYEVDPTPPYAASLWLDLETMYPDLTSGGITIDALVFAHGFIWLLRNPGPANHILIQVDLAGTIIDSFALASTATYGPEGITFDGSCFWYTDHTNDQVYRFCLYGQYDTLAIPACLDSREPRITLDCPTEPVTSGELLDLVWHVDDLSFGFDPGTLIVGTATDLDTYEVTDTTLSFIPPFGCDSIYVFLRVPDNFCNSNFDTCQFKICNEMATRLDCAPCGGFTSCTTQTAEFMVSDTACSSEIQSAFFTLKLFHPSGDSTILYRAGPSPDIIFAPLADSTRVTMTDIPYSDGDSIWISFDSLFTIEGCKTEP